MPLSIRALTLLCDGLLTSLHIKFDHPTASQLKMVVQHYFYALDMDAAVQRVSSGCHQCPALWKAPVFVADLRVTRQKLSAPRLQLMCSGGTASSLWLSGSVSHGLHCLVSLMTNVKRLSVSLCPLDGPFAVVRTDPAPGFAALAGDTGLAAHRLVVEVGNANNITKNPVAEKAIQEIQGEIMRLEPNCRAVTPLLLSA